MMTILLGVVMPHRLSPARLPGQRASRWTYRPDGHPTGPAPTLAAGQTRRAHGHSPPRPAIDLAHPRVTGRTRAGARCGPPIGSGGWRGVPGAAQRASSGDPSMARSVASAMARSAASFGSTVRANQRAEPTLPS